MVNSPSRLFSQIDHLLAAVAAEGDAQAVLWNGRIDRASFRPSAHNLACYLALRRRDLRALQRPLMALGLSSLGRLEGRVLPTLTAVRSALAALAGKPAGSHPSLADFFAGESRLGANTREILGTGAAPATAALLVTCPGEAGDDGDFMLAMARKGVEAVRINCAHDTPEQWRAMIANLRLAEAATGRRLKVFMDLAGPKIRTGRVRSAGKGHTRACCGEMTDAAMAARAECVMLNKGPYLIETIDQLRALLARMSDHQHKKTPQLRALRSWREQVGDPVSGADQRHPRPAVGG